MKKIIFLILVFCQLQSDQTCHEYYSPNGEPLTFKEGTFNFGVEKTLSDRELGYFALGLSVLCGTSYLIYKRFKMAKKIDLINEPSSDEQNI